MPQEPAENSLSSDRQEIDHAQLILRPDPRVVVYDSVEMFSYLRDINSLNTALKMHGSVEMFSRLHSRVAICSLHQILCLPKVYYPGSDQPSEEYMKDPAGYVGEMFGKEKNVMELRRIMELANVNDQVEEVESIEERCDSFQTLDCYLPIQFEMALTDFHDVLAQLQRADAGRWVTPNITIDKEVWEDKRGKAVSTHTDETIVSGRKESPIFNEEADHFRNLLKVFKCLAYLRIQDPEDPNTGHDYLRAVLEEFLDKDDPNRAELLNCILPEYRDCMPSLMKDKPNILNTKNIKKVLKTFQLANFSASFGEYLKKLEETVLGKPKMISSGLYCCGEGAAEGGVKEEQSRAG
eukprot:CAMPEP_0118636752 /NCGR_PEP_ID=MMETSP0785-20121206/2792_1 /TAXON_ID=91992 /ORGANISM="Bolidomonas pacifica, Strain CCMP 1866" /LENGTH=351 /DNA_ID=CAMNT_0006527903 /DNA_START=107 /DNA_END=1159 /DNA_ORIENTATION=-